MPLGVDKKVGFKLPITDIYRFQFALRSRQIWISRSNLHFPRSSINRNMTEREGGDISRNVSTH